MEYINNRYRIIENLNSDENISEHKAFDTINNKIVKLCLVDKYYWEKVCKKQNIEMRIYNKLNSASIFNVFDIGLVKNINNKRIDRTYYYYYSVEYIGDYFHLKDIIDELNNTELIDLFIQISKALNYIHMHKIVYKNLNPDNIVVYKSDNSYKIKIVDIITASLNENKNKNLEYKAPELIFDKKQKLSADIYSLGMIFKNKFLKLNDIKGINNKEGLLINYKFEKRIGLIKILKKMINKDINKRFGNINQLISEINDLYDKKFCFYNDEDKKMLNLKTRIYGRVNELDKLRKYYNSIDKTGNKIVFIHGGKGNGKTTLLKEFENELNQQNVLVYSKYLFKKTAKINDVFTENIFTEIINESDRNLIKKYERSINTLIKEIDKKEFNSLQNKFKIQNDIINYFAEFIGKKKIVIIIDNINYVNKSFLEFIKICLAKKNLAKKIMFVFSYTDGEISNNKTLQEFINKINDFSIYIEVGGLKFNEVEEFIIDILNMKYFSNEFINKIFQHTYGNPFFIKETIKDLYEKQVIYFDENLGTWACDVENHEKIKMPNKLKNTIINQIEQLSDKSYSLLEKISALQDAASKNIIYQVSKKSKEEIDSILDRLRNAGILYCYDSNKENRYTFSNKILKNIIYENINENEKINYHSKIASILEKEFLAGKTQNVNDMIEHLYKAEEKEKLIKYCYIQAEKFKEKNDKEKAIKYLKNITNTINDKEITKENIKYYRELADLLKENGNTEDALVIYKKVEEYSSDLNLTDLRVDVLRNIIVIYNRKNEMNKINEHIEVLRKIAYTSNSKYAYLRYKLVKMTLNIMVDHDYNESIEEFSECVELCKQEYPYLKAKFLRGLSVIRSFKGELEESIRDLKEAYKYYQKAEDYTGQVLCFNSLAALSFDYKQNLEEAVEYFLNCRELCYKGNVLSELSIILINLADINICINELEKAKGYLDEALANAEAFEDIQMNLYIYCHYIKYYVKIKDYNNIEKIYSQIKQILNTNDNLISITGDIYEGAFLRNIMYGDIEKAEEMCNLFEKEAEKHGNRLKHKFDIYKILIKILSNKDTDFNEISNIRNISDKILIHCERMSFLIELTEMFLNYGYNKHAKKIFEIIHEEINEDKINYDLKIKYTCLQAIFTDEICLEELNKLFDLYSKKDNKAISIHLSNILGEKYLKAKNYILAANYTLISIDYIKTIISSVSKEDYLKFLKANGFIEVFNNMIQILEYYKQGIKRRFHSIENDVERIINYKFLDNILDSNKFKNECKRLYRFTELYHIENIEDVTRNLSIDPLKNLKFILKYLSNISLATNSGIVLIDSFNEYKIIESTDNKNTLSLNTAVLERANKSKKEILLRFDDKNNLFKSKDGNDIKAIICIPIMDRENPNDIHVNERRKYKISNDRVVGFLYLETNKVLNNFNEEAVDVCIKYSNLLALCIGCYEFKMLSAIDKLTETYTRKYILESLKKNIDKCRIEGQVVSILMCDIDYFKIVNDKLGHQKGDYVLSKVCEIMKNNLRITDLIGRYGGEEFLVVLPNTNKSNAKIVAEKLRKKVENSNILNESFKITISIGIATYPEHAYLMDDLIEKADKALYWAKESGRNLSETYNILFENKNSGTNKLSGIISGNSVEDSRNVLSMLEILDIVNDDDKMEGKIFKFLGRAIERVEAEYGMLFITKSEKIYCRKRFEENWISTWKKYNKKIIDDVTNNKKGLCIIDWENYSELNAITGLPDWDSTILIPMTYNNEVVAVLYLTVPSSEKEFTGDEYNFIETLCKIIVRIFY